MTDNGAATPPDDNTDALPPGYTDVVVYHGREFHRESLETNTYFMPIDYIEVERQQMMHSIFGELFERRLVFPPELDSMTRVLDCGTGTGTWAEDVAFHYPECEVLGLDSCSNTFPELSQNNLMFQVCDLNYSFAEYHLPNGTFDFVNSRLIADGINADRWPSYLRDIRRVLRPGGWCQLIEIYFNAQSDNDTLTDDHALRQWSRRYLGAMERCGKDPRAGRRLHGWMRDAGFVNVESTTLTLPMCGWSNDEITRGMGNWNKENVSRLLSSLALYPVVERQRLMTINNFHLMVGQARAEAATRAFKPYFEVWVVVGQRRPSQKT